MTKAINRVLIIDDEEVDQKIYKRVITRTGLAQEVLGFTDARTALEYLVETKCEGVDLIFLDISMPRMNGFEFLEAAISTLGDTLDAMVLIMLTTSLAPNDRERAAEFEIVSDFLNKPLTEDDIRTASRRLNEKRTVS